jgi:hypothetical protein
MMHRLKLLDNALNDPNLSPNDAATNAMLCMEQGMSFRELGMFREGLTSLQRALEFTPTDKETRLEVSSVFTVHRHNFVRTHRIC